jgi:Transposase DNA-binding
MERKTLGFGSTEEFFSSEFEALDLHDKRLNKRALQIFKSLQLRLTSCIRRLFLEEKEMRQAYDFF